MRISEALQKAKEKLLKSNKNLRAGLEAEILLGYVMGVRREWLHAHAHQELTSAHLEDFHSLIHQRLEGMPIAYLTNSASFYSRDFYVDASVLIPRWETEILIDKLNPLICNHRLSHIAEIGTGSGIIAITLALQHPQIRILATDISQAALWVAQKNILRFHTNSNQLKQRIQLICTPYLEGIEQDFDLLVSNPPYIAKNTKLEADVLNEPHLALFGGENGDEMLKEIISLTKKRKIPYLACEMGCDQKASLQEALSAQGFRAEFYQDYARLNRGFIAQATGR